MAKGFTGFDINNGLEQRVDTVIPDQRIKALFKKLVFHRHSVTQGGACLLPLHQLKVYTVFWKVVRKIQLRI